MIIPVRCFTCGKVIGNKWDEFYHLSKQMPMDQVFSELGIDRYCCRRMLISHVNLIGTLSSYDLPSEKLKQ